MRLSRFLNIASMAMFFSLLLFSCDQAENGGRVPGQEDPKLELVSLRLFDETKKGNNSTDFTFNVPNTTTSITNKNVGAEFKCGSKIDDTLPVIIAYKTGNSLVEGDNTIVLSVVAVPGKYQDWKKEIKVIRASSGGNDDPKPRLSYLKVFDEETTNLDALQFNVSNTTTSITDTNVIAKFNYGSKTNDRLPVTVAYKTGNSLVEGDNTIVLSVVAVPGKYQDWTKEIKVIRASSGGSTGVSLKPISLKVKTSSTPIKWEFAQKSGNDFSIEVPTSIATIAEADIEAYFEWDGMEAPKPRKLSFTVEGGFPIQLADPGTAKEINMTVPADSNGVYLAFNNKLTITRKNSNDAKLKKIKLQGKTFTKKEITDLEATAEAIETHAQDVNVFFYSDVASVAEDSELINRITTEPELRKVGNLKVWDLNKVDNTLKVMVDGNPVYTVKVTRKPLLVESISVFAGGVAITNNAEAGQTYSTTASDIQIAVMPKQLNSGYLVYKNVKVKAGDANEADLSQNSPTDPTQGFSGIINLTADSTPIVITITDPSDNDAFKFTLNFTINKEADPSTGAIDASVQIEELWVGDGNMDALNVNKFKAEQNSGDVHRYTVHVNKTGYSKQKVALIVKGGANAQTADVKDGIVATSVKADGVSVFTSGATYTEVKGNGKKFTFMLENAGKKALYEVTCVFDVVVKHTITVTKPEHGTIKAYQMKAGKRLELTISGNNTLEVPAGEYAYFELIADDGKTPAKLVIDGQEYTSTSGVSGQTSGAIAGKIKVTKNFNVTGECNP